ncbi:MAG: DUF885 domain-containing protein [Propionibacteriaceae bacterium]|jgi:uncharacterized protein (DUF885 family)|nr:DUF885 domain-containing protein [Propionibacteriaceae bacterium]
MSETRPWSAIDALAEAYLDQSVALSPLLATEIGSTVGTDRLDDFSPAGLAAKAELAQATLLRLDRLTEAGVEDPVDQVTVWALRDRLGANLELDRAGEPYRELNVLSSPQHQIEEVFALMPQDSLDDWQVIADRLGQVPTALAGHVETLRLGAGRGLTPARHQVELAARDARRQSQTGSVFAQLVDQAAQAPWATSPAGGQLLGGLRSAAGTAEQAYADLAEFLERELIGPAVDQDGVGAERYALWSRYFLGATVDLRETYAWGLEELDRIVREQADLVGQLYGPGVSLEEAIDRLDGDPKWRVEGVEALREWLQSTADQAVAALDGVHFDIPEPARRLEGRISPTHSGGIYYTGPSDDFSRPGRMWWSVPEGVDSFTTWRERTTVYHEGVPGHHLQIAQAVFLRHQLNRWRRFSGSSGHAEGWALYAERFMDEQGFLPHPADRLGMLDGQRLRAARVVLDIGVHLGLPFPDGSGVSWDRHNAWAFLRANSNMGQPSLRFELNRYLGWPGQAPSYKIGQRLWQSLRDTALASGSPLRQFHRDALDLGGLGLDVLARALGRPARPADLGQAD